jgi:cell division transport system permease protein
MQLRYVASELGTGLKRNLSMTFAVIVSIWMSLSLVGLGLLINTQVGMIEEDLGSKVEVRVVFCAENSASPQCVAGQATPDQEADVRQALDESDEVADYRYKSRQEYFESYRASHRDLDGDLDPIAAQVKVSDMPSTYIVKLENPEESQVLLSSVRNLPGVDEVIDLRQTLSPIYDILNFFKWLSLGAAAVLIFAAVLQVSNTVRLAAMARRREIGIMRLVGASSLYIQLPFVLEIVLAALVGAALACGTLAVVIWQFVPKAQSIVKIWPWAQWEQAVPAMVWIVVIAMALAVIPTMLMTRKYLKV